MISFYIFKNQLNNKVYVGSSNNPNRRYQEHCTALYNNKHPNKHLQYAFNQEESYFKFKVLFTLEEEACREVYEQYLIDFYGAFSDDLGYNLADASGLSYRLPLSGERSGMAKLFDKDVKLIYNRLESGELAASIAREYNVDPDTIQKIRQGRHWKNITGGKPITWDQSKFKPNAKLSINDVNTIKFLCQKHTQKEVATMFKIHQSQVSRIVNNRRWSPESR